MAEVHLNARSSFNHSNQHKQQALQTLTFASTSINFTLTEQHIAARVSKSQKSLHAISVSR